MAAEEERRWGGQDVAERPSPWHEYQECGAHSAAEVGGRGFKEERLELCLERYEELFSSWGRRRDWEREREVNKDGGDDQCAREEISRFCMDFNEREEQNQDGPNIFGYYCRGVALLLADSDDLTVDVDDNHSKDEIDKPTTKVELEGARTSTNSNSLFSDRALEISNFKKENLESFLTQATLDLSTEFDQVRRSLLKLHEVMTILRSNQGATHSDPDGRCHKKIKMTPTSVSNPRSPVIAISGESSSNIGRAKSQGEEYRLVSSDETDHRSRDEDAALQLLLENNGPMVELLLNKYLDEQYANLAYMVSQIDQLLDELFSRWRPMTHLEKQQLQKLIKDLPERHLSVVAELLTCARRTVAEECNEIFVDLKKEENQTLWKIYYYISAKLSSR